MRTKNLTFKERVNRINKVPNVDFTKGFEVIHVTECVENDVVVKKMDVVNENDINNNKDLKVSDFKIENLQASGAIKGLKLYGSRPDIKALENELTEFEKTINENIKEEE